MHHLLASLLLLTTTLLPTPASASCSTFTATTSLYNISNSYNTTLFPWSTNGLRVSPAITCTNGTPNIIEFDSQSYFCHAPNCTLAADASIVATGYSNLSLSDADTAALFNLAKSNVSGQYGAQGWHYNVSGIIDGAAFCVANGQSGYAAFWPLMHCVNGTVSGCSNGPVQDGTGVQVCGAALDPFDTAFLTGTVGFTNTSREVAAGLAGSPNTTSAAAGGWALGRQGGMVEMWRWGVGFVVVGLGVSVLG